MSWSLRRGGRQKIILRQRAFHIDSERLRSGCRGYHHSSARTGSSDPPSQRFRMTTAAGLDGHCRVRLFGRPYVANAARLITDCIRLMTIEPMSRSNRKCGFVEAGARCTYVWLGFGCPERGLTEAERSERRSAEMSETWCHKAVSDSYLW